MRTLRNACLQYACFTAKNNCSKHGNDPGSHCRIHRILPFYAIKQWLQTCQGSRIPLWDPQGPTVLCNKTMGLSMTKIQDPIVGSTGSYRLCNKTMVLNMTRIQDPIIGSTGSYCFYRQSCCFAHLPLPPRALITILKKARGACWSLPAGSLLAPGLF